MNVDWLAGPPKPCPHCSAPLVLVRDENVARTPLALLCITCDGPEVDDIVRVTMRGDWPRGAATL